MDDKTPDGDNGQKPEQGKYQIMDAEDRLRSENLQLKLMNMGLQEEGKLRELAKLRADRAEVQQQFIKLRKELEKKYDVNLSTVEVRAGDGAIIPSGSTPPGQLR
jgi:hypothetical protein